MLHERQYNANHNYNFEVRRNAPTWDYITIRLVVAGIMIYTYLDTEPSIRAAFRFTYGRVQIENADVLDVGDVPSVCPLAVKAAEACAGTSSKKPLVTQVPTLVFDELHATSDTLSSWQLPAFFEQHFR